MIEQYKFGGISAEQLATNFSIGIATVKRWVSRDRQNQLEPFNKPGRPSVVGDEHLAFISKCIISNPSVTLMELKYKLFKRYGFDFSEAYMCKLVKRLGFKRKKKQYLPTEQLRPDVKKKG